MCAESDKATTEQFRKRKTPQRAYKVIVKSSGRPCIKPRQGFVYRPGRNVDPFSCRTTYASYMRYTKGLHCYLNRGDAQRARGGCFYDLTVVPVTFKPADVIAVEAPATGCRRQVVVRALHISLRAWKQAGLPAKMKGGV